MNSLDISMYSLLSAVLFWLAALTLIAGVVMLLAPGWLFRTSDRISFWVDTSNWFRKLDEQRNFERLFYHHHVIMGLFILVGSLYSLWFLWHLQAGELLVLMPDLDNAVLGDILHTALAWALLAGNVGALIIGIMVLVRPSQLKAIEAWSNRWMDSSQLEQTMDRREDAAERAISVHPRLFGLLVVLGSLYIMSNTLYAVFPG